MNAVLSQDPALDAVGLDHRRPMARYQAAIFVGAGLGPVAGGFIAEYFGIAAPFWFYAAVSAFAMIVSATVTTQEPEPLPSRVDLRAQFSAAIGNPILRANLVLAFANGFVRTAALWQLVPLLAAARFGMGFDKVGLAVTITSLANVLILPLSGNLVDRFGWRYPPPLASIGYALSLLMIAGGPVEAVFWAGVILAGVFGGLIRPASSTAVIELTDPTLLPSASGLQRTGDSRHAHRRFFTNPRLGTCTDRSASARLCADLGAGAQTLATNSVKAEKG